MERPKAPSAREIMTASLVTLRPEMAAADAAEILLARRISGAPVVDAEGCLVGLLSEFDCLRAVVAAQYEMDSHDDAVTVGELMTRESHTISPDLDLFSLAHEFVQTRFRRFPVVENGELLGQVSRRDALRAALKLRQQLRGRRNYPDYPEGRDPIRNYPH